MRINFFPESRVLARRLLIVSRRHWLAIATAFIVGLVMIAPQIFFIIQAGPRYQGLNIFATDAEYFYISRIAEVYDGHYSIANSILQAGKNLPYAQPPLPELLMGLSGKLLCLNIATVLIVFRFFAPAFLFLLIYGLVVRLCGDRRSGIIAAAFIILASNLISTPFDLWQMIRGHFSGSLFLDYSRPINPQISSLFFFGFLYWYWRLHQTNNRWFGIGCMMVFGLSFYVYPYTWSLLLVFLSLMFLAAVWQRQRRNALWISAISIGGFVIAIPYFVNVYQLIHDPSYGTLTDSWGLHAGRPFVVGSILCIAVALLAVIHKINKKNNNYSLWFLLALLISGFIALNQQLITGRVFYYGHYHWYYNKPFFAIIVAISIGALLRYYKVNLKIQQTFATVLVGIFLYNGIMIQWVSYQYHFNHYLALQSYRPVIDWLKKNAAKDSVVYVPGSFYYPIDGRTQERDTPSLALSRFIVSYTSLNLYFNEYANFYLLPYDQYKQYNLFITLKLLGVKPDVAFVFLRRQPEFFYDVYYSYFKVRGLTYNDLPDSLIAKAVFDYQNFDAITWPAILKKYPLDYIVWDKNDLSNLNFDQIQKHFPQTLQTVYDVNNVIIYRVD